MTVKKKNAQRSKQNSLSAGTLLFIVLCICSLISTIFDSNKTSATKPTRTPVSASLSNSAAFTAAPTKHIRLNACVGNSTIRIRRGPGTQYEAIGGLAAGTCMTILGRSEDSSWVYMTAGGETGWVAAWLITIDGSLYGVPVEYVSIPLPTNAAESIQ